MQHPVPSNSKGHASFAAPLLRAWRAVWRRDGANEHSSHQETYDSKYYEFIEFTSTWSRDTMAESIVRDLAPRHAVDIGCGTGALLEALRSRAIDVAGLEYSDVALKSCQERGLAVRKFDIAQHRLPRRMRKRDLAISFEVAEHLPPQFSDRFVKLLTMAGNTVVMSAATPGQGGTNHFNEQPHEYWIAKMNHCGFAMDHELSQRWRAEWRGKTADWYHANVMVFRRSPRRFLAA
jgi:cyclopropane fatty-acyl-phospholipid synthase-like methyltransferase